jgi:hypothetical protein
MAGFKPSKAPSTKMGPIKVPSPKANPMGSHRPPLGFPHVVAPRIKPLKTRIYSKGVTQQDPSQFGANGFGDTGLTGES